MTNTKWARVGTYWELFERGKYQQIRELVRPPGGSSEARAALIAALAWMGRKAEAWELYRLDPHFFSAQDLARCRFALVVTLVRASRWSIAKRILQESLAQAELAESAATAQAMAFGFFDRGRYQQASKWGRRALQRAFAQGDEFFQLLAMDLLGHCLFLRGRRAEGLSLLSEAVLLAEARGENDTVQALKASILRFEAEIGRRPESICQELEVAVRNLRLEDSYSKGDLILEWARQLTRRGRWSEARQKLDELAPALYGWGNRRKEALLQFRLAEVAFRQGDRSAVVHMLGSARRCLSQVKDPHYEKILLGLEIKIQSQLWGQGASSEQLSRLEELTRLESDPPHERYLRRLGLSPSSGEQQPALIRAGEDPFGDEWDRVLSDPTRVWEFCRKTEAWGFLPQLLGFPPGAEVWGLTPESRFFRLHSEGVFVSEAPFSALHLKLFRRLKKGAASKASLIQEVWGYEYEPLRHDALVYSSLAGFRRSLGPGAADLLTTETGWSLREGVRFFEADEDATPVRLRLDEESRTFPQQENQMGLNERQIRFLRRLRPEDFISISDYKARFRISTMTAWRDLSSLVEKGHLRSLGAGRATRYCRR